MNINLHTIQHRSYRLAKLPFIVRAVAMACIAMCSRAAFATDAIIGFTEPVKTIELAASETGTLAQLDIKPGDSVNANRVIGSLDSEVLRATREFGVAKQDSQAKLKAASIRLERAKVNYEKLQQLRDEGHGGNRELHACQTEKVTHDE